MRLPPAPSVAFAALPLAVSRAGHGPDIFTPMET